MTIKITHKGEDYYGVEVNGEYKEYDLTTGEAIIGLLQAKKNLEKALKSIIENNL